MIRSGKLKRPANPSASAPRPTAGVQLLASLGREDRQPVLLPVPIASGRGTPAIALGRGRRLARLGPASSTARHWRPNDVDLACPGRGNEAREVGGGSHREFQTLGGNAVLHVEWRRLRPAWSLRECETPPQRERPSNPTRVGKSSAGSRPTVGVIRSSLDLCWARQASTMRLGGRPAAAPGVSRQPSPVRVS